MASVTIDEFLRRLPLESLANYVADPSGGIGLAPLRPAIHELLDLSEHIRQMILDKRPSAEIKRAAREEGMTFLRESALEKARRSSFMFSTLLLVVSIALLFLGVTLGHHPYSLQPS